jgi:hypothetical protein
VSFILLTCQQDHVDATSRLNVSLQLAVAHEQVNPLTGGVPKHVWCTVGWLLALEAGQ